MQSLQANPSDTDNACYKATELSNVELDYMFKESNYSTGVIT